MTSPLPFDLTRTGPGARFIVVLRSPDVDDSLAARLADPLWMLARQWQLGEFRGDDAGSLVSLDFHANAHMPTWWRPEPDVDQTAAQPWQSWTVSDGPLEATIDAELDDGSAWLRLNITGGVAARRALCAAGLAAIARQLPTAAPWPPGHDNHTGAGIADAASPLDRLVMAATANATQLEAFIAPWADPSVPMPQAAMAQLGVTAADAATVAAVLREWRTWWRTHSSGTPSEPATGPVDPPSWDTARLEHRGSLAFASAPDVRLHIDRHPGGPVDWYSADLAHPDPTHPPTPPPVPVAPGKVTAPVIPQPARLSGMPALRFWEYEDAAVDFGGIDAAPADLARLLLVDYTTVYDHNWYFAPLRVSVGALVEAVDPVTVVDSFGQPITLQPLAERPEANTRMFTPTAPPGADPTWSTRWFWFAPRLAATLDSEPIEQVGLRRDESANLGWAIISIGSDPYGRASSMSSSASTESTSATTGAAASKPHYIVRSALPPTWRALVPTPIASVPPSTAYLLVLDAPDPGPSPTIRLLAGNNWAIHEEELGDAGLTLTRTRTLGRWYGGTVYTWAGRSVWPGGGEADSGLAWDYTN